MANERAHNYGGEATRRDATDEERKFERMSRVIFYTPKSTYTWSSRRDNGGDNGGDNDATGQTGELSARTAHAF